MKTFVFFLIIGAASLTGCSSADPQTAAPAVTPTTGAPVQPSAPAGQATPANTPFDRRALVSEIVGALILPLHTQLVNEIDALEAAVEHFAAEPSPETLAAAQEQWRKAAVAWARVEPFQFRFSMLVSNEIKKWPINTSIVEKTIATGERIDEASIAASGSTAKGLAAMEYLLFAPPGEAAALRAMEGSSQRMDYLVALARNLAGASRELLQLWLPGGDGQAEALVEGASVDNRRPAGSISMLTNEMIGLLEGIVKTKLDYPLHGVYAEAQPDAVESPYAAHSLPLIIANLESLQAVFDGGLADYVEFLAGDARLANAISVQFGKAIAAVGAIEPTLEDAVISDPDAVRTARDEVRSLLVLIKVDMANQMGVTVTFSDNDGD